jgi:hypothetical protein
MDYRAKLSELSRNALNDTAKKLNIRNYSQGTKGELVETIVSTRSPKQIKKVVSPSLWDRYHNHVYGVASVIGVFLGIWALLPKAGEDSPKEPVPTPVVTPSVSEPTPHIIQPTPSSSPTPSPAQTRTVNLSPSPKRQPEPKKQSASEHINRARTLLSRGPDYYSAALAECDLALRLEPDNQNAIALKNSIRALDKLYKQKQ